MFLRSLHRAALLAASAVVSAPAWAATGSPPVWVASLLFIVAAALVIALLLREARFDETTDDPPQRDETSLPGSPPRYHAGEAARETAANHCVA